MESSSSSVPDSLLNKLKRIFTSTLLFITAFIAAKMLMELFVAFFCHFLGYGVEICYNQIAVKPRDYHAWSKLRVLAIYATAPLLCLVIGVLLFNWLNTKTAKINTSRAFAFWMMMCLVNLCLSHLLFSPLGVGREHFMGFYQTFAVAATWMGLNSGIMTLFAAIALAATVIWGAVVRNELLRYSFSTRRIKSQWGKNRLVFELYLIPIALGAFPLLMLTSTQNLFPTCFVLFNMAPMAAGMFARNFNDKVMIRGNKKDVLNHFPLPELLIAGAVWVCIFIFLRY